jgi:arsenite methyltransferase
VPDQGLSDSQAQTQSAFSYKWSRRETYESSAVQDEWARWLLEKYFDGETDGPANFLQIGGRLRVLDAGCGAGVSALLLFGDLLQYHDYVGVDISESVHEAEVLFRDRGIPAHFIQANLADLPPDLGDFDVIFSEGVLHHTDSVQDSLCHLASRLRPGGRILFYVYVKKAPIREFTDDYIRGLLAEMSDDEAWEALIPLTLLGKSLGELDVDVEVPEDVTLLGIPSGTYSLQRLFFYKFLKAFYRPEYSLQEMNHVNFDWFRPLNCHRLSPQELLDSCAAAGLVVDRLHEGESGLTVVAHREPSEVL